MLHLAANTIFIEGKKKLCKDKHLTTWTTKWGAKWCTTPSVIAWRWWWWRWRRWRRRWRRGGGGRRGGCGSWWRRSRPGHQYTCRRRTPRTRICTRCCYGIHCGIIVTTLAVFFRFSWLIGSSSDAMVSSLVKCKG
jgi:hypothetical protein